MGISIHYNGKFSSKAKLSELIVEIKEIAEVLRWEYEVYLESFPNSAQKNESHNNLLYGISFMPPNCEPVSVCFLSNRRMCSYINLKFYGNSISKPERDYLYMLSTKTQYAGYDIHKSVIKIFQHLNNRNYFEEFSLRDEAEYWETNDDILLKQKFKVSANLLDAFALATKSVPKEQNENYESYFERLSKLISNNPSSK